MANAYATIANGGERADVHVVEKVVDRNGEVRYSRKDDTRTAVDEDIAADTSYAMQQIVQNGTGQAALALGRPAAGKTGTATNDKDQVSSAWFAGYTPQLATAVMYVRGDGDNQLDGWLPSYFGAVYPAQTWTAIMRARHGRHGGRGLPGARVRRGRRPTDGHEPYVPPATTTTSTPQPQPQPSPTKKPSRTPTIKTEEPSPTETPDADRRRRPRRRRPPRRRCRRRRCRRRPCRPRPPRPRRRRALRRRHPRWRPRARAPPRRSDDARAPGAGEPGPRDPGRAMRTGYTPAGTTRSSGR